jgi:hypothetical protein
MGEGLLRDAVVNLLATAAGLETPGAIVTVPEQALLVDKSLNGVAGLVLWIADFDVNLPLAELAAVSKSNFASRPMERDSSE